MKDEAALLAVLAPHRVVGSLAEAGGGASTSLTGRLSAVHATQAEVIAACCETVGSPSR